jgi:hypothetical protein
MLIKDLTFQRDSFSLETTRPQARQLTVALEGCADLRVQSEFDAAIRRIHDEARRKDMALICVDMTRLEFMNSGCFKCLCTWVRLRLSEGTYKIQLISNPRYHWQVRSLNALEMLAPAVISIKIQEQR